VRDEEDLSAVDSARAAYVRRARSTDPGKDGGRAVGFADVESRAEIGQIELAGGAVSFEMHEDGETALSCAQDGDNRCVISVPERRILHIVRVKDGGGPDPALLLEGG
jgi:hypothetical protein